MGHITSNRSGTNECDLWAVRRSSTDGNWGTPVELTTASPYSMNHQPAISSDGAKVVFECTNETYSGVGCICEVGTDGQGFRVVLTPTDSPVGLPDEADMHSPDYAPDGSIVSLWLNRPGGSGDHELKVMTSDGSSYFMLVTGVDVLDIGLGCGN